MKLRVREKSTSETNPNTSFNFVKVSNSCKFQGNLLRREVFSPPTLRERHQNQLHWCIRHRRAAVSSTLWPAGLSRTHVKEGSLSYAGWSQGLRSLNSVSPWCWVFGRWAVSFHFSYQTSNTGTIKARAEGIVLLHQPQREHSQNPGQAALSYSDSKWCLCMSHWNSYPTETQTHQMFLQSRTPTPRSTWRTYVGTSHKETILRRKCCHLQKILKKKHVQLFKKSMSSWKVSLTQLIKYLKKHLTFLLGRSFTTVPQFSHNNYIRYLTSN